MLPLSAVSALLGELMDLTTVVPGKVTPDFEDEVTELTVTIRYVEKDGVVFIIRDADENLASLTTRNVFACFIGRVLHWVEHPVWLARAFKWFPPPSEIEDKDKGTK